MGGHDSFVAVSRASEPEDVISYFFSIFNIEVFGEI